MKKFILFSILIIMGIVSCGEKKVKPTNMNSQNSFIVSDTWMRPGVKHRNSAGFLRITNNTNYTDTLIGVKSGVAELTELHETFRAENDMMGMRNVDEIVIPSNSVIELKPGSFHIMFIGLRNDVAIGDTNSVTLMFKRNGNVKVNLEVK